MGVSFPVGLNVTRSSWTVLAAGSGETSSLSSPSFESGSCLRENRSHGERRQRPEQGEEKAVARALWLHPQHHDVGLRDGRARCGAESLVLLRSAGGIVGRTTGGIRTSSDGDHVLLHG